jgi:hypothetical protein
MRFGEYGRKSPGLNSAPGMKYIESFSEVVIIIAEYLCLPATRASLCKCSVGEISQHLP